MQGGHAAVVPGVQRLQHVECFVTARLTHDGAVGVHSNCIPPQGPASNRPTPSTWAGGVSIRTTCDCCSPDSAALSVVAVCTEPPPGWDGLRCEIRISGMVRSCPGRTEG